MQSSYVRHRRKTTRTAYKTTANARLRRHASFHEEIAFDRTRYTMNVAAPMIAEARPGLMMFLKIAGRAEMCRFIAIRSSAVIEM